MVVHSIRLASDKYTYRHLVDGVFTDKDLRLIIQCLDRFLENVGDELGGVMISREFSIHMEKGVQNHYLAPLQLQFNPTGLTEWTVTHELSHALDGSHDWQLSQRMKTEMRSYWLCKPIHARYPDWKIFWYHAGSPPPPCGVDKNFNSLEDFAEVLTAHIFPDLAYQKATARGYPYGKWGFTHFHQTPRGRFIANLIAGNKYKTPS